MSNRNCPCGSCVTCACAATPAVDEDGLCLGCGGQPWSICVWNEDDVPHVGHDVEGEDRERIEKIIATESARQANANDAVATE